MTGMWATRAPGVGRLIVGFLALLLLGVPVRSASMSEVMFFQDHGRMRFNNQSALGGCWNGRIHFNGQMETVPGSLPFFPGFVTQVSESVPGLPENYFDSVFAGGFRAGYDVLAWPPSDHIEALKSQTTPDRIFAGVDSLLRPVTTRIRFREGWMSVSRYLPQETTPDDTLYLMDHEELPYPEVPLLWIQGVARIEGVVGQSLTLIVSDSLFITGDLIVPGTNTVDCDNPDTFGMAPELSPVQIGLIGEKDVIIAATLANGLGNGVSNPWLDCGLEDEPVISDCGQARKDVIITAAILALDCSFFTEFWKTTAWGATPPTEPETFSCSSGQNQQNEILPCAGAPGTDDLRGSLWFCGSLFRNGSGYLSRSLPNSWSANIGYRQVWMRHDSNFLRQPPPFWPELVWIDDDPPSIGISFAGLGYCGQSVPGEEFLSFLADDRITLHITAHDTIETDHEQLLVTAWLDGVAVGTRLEILEEGASVDTWPAFDFPLEETHELFFTVDWDAQTWNRDGDLCRWTFILPNLDPPTLSLSPWAMTLCQGAVSWDAFIAHYNASDLWVDFQVHPLTHGGVEFVQVETWTDHGLVDLRSGTLRAGATERFFPILPGNLPTTPTFVYLVIRWDDESWNTNGSDCLWSMGTVAVDPPRDGQPESLALRIAPNPANPTFTIEYEVPVAGETSLELYDLRGRKVQTLASGPKPAGSHRVTVDLGPGASGLYFVRLLTPAGQRVEKVLVVR